MLGKAQSPTVPKWTTHQLSVDNKVDQWRPAEELLHTLLQWSHLLLREAYISRPHYFCSYKISTRLRCSKQCGPPPSSLSSVVSSQRPKSSLLNPTTSRHVPNLASVGAGVPSQPVHKQQDLPGSLPTPSTRLQSCLHLTVHHSPHLSSLPYTPL